MCGSSEDTHVDRFYPSSVRVGVAGTLNLLHKALVGKTNT